MRLPHTIKYTERVEAGSANMFRIKINPRYEFDKGLYEHEYTHIKQWYRLTIPLAIITLIATYYTDYFTLFALLFCVAVHDFSYETFKWYRQRCEVEAFKAQLKIGGELHLAAKALSENYNLDITKQDAIRLLAK